MGITELNGCCFYFSLKTGTQIIAYVQGICSVILLVFFSYFSIHPEVLLGEETRNAKLNATGAYDILVVFLIMATAMFGVSLLFSSLLIIGIKRNRSSLFIPWLISQLVGLFAYILQTFLGLIYGDTPVKTIALNLIECSIISATTIYFYLVVSSLRMQMKRDSLKMQEDKYLPTSCDAN